MNQSPDISKLAPALVAAQSAMKAVAKDSINPAFKSHFVSLDGLIESVRPILAAHKLAFLQGATTPHTDENGKVSAFVGETMILHETGQWLAFTIVMPVAKCDPQGVGSAMTYFRRYGLAAILGISSEDDDDGNAGSARPAPAAKSNNGTADFHAFVMPMGKSKGKPLSAIDTKDLESAIDWAAEKGKFEEFQAAGEKELESRKAESLDFDGASS